MSKLWSRFWRGSIWTSTAISTCTCRPLRRPKRMYGRPLGNRPPGLTLRYTRLQPRLFNAEETRLKLRVPVCRKVNSLALFDAAAGTSEEPGGPGGSIYSGHGGTERSDGGGARG